MVSGGQKEDTRRKNLKRAIPALVGLGILLAIDVVLIVDIELTLHINQALQASRDESQWGFGQILAMVLLAGPIWQCFTMPARRQISHKREEHLDSLMRWAVEAKDIERIGHCVGLGADVNVAGKGEEPQSRQEMDI